MTLVQRLLVLVGTVLAIFVAAWLYGTVSIRNAQERTIRSDMERALSLVSSKYGSFVERVQHALIAVTLEAPHAVTDAGGCRALVGWLQNSGLDWLRIDVLDARGVVRCSTEQGDVGNDMSDYPEVVAARTNGRTLVGDYAWGLFSGAPGLVMARAWRGRDGAVGVVDARARLDPLLREIPESLPHGYAAILADSGGRVLATEPPDQDMIGHTLSPSLALLARMPASGHVVMQWSDGSERLVAYAPADKSHGQGVFFALAAAAGTGVTGAPRFVYASGLGCLMVVVAAFVLAWWGGVHFIRRPLGELADIALRWKDGDQMARVTLPGRSEIAALGRAFNAMADAKDLSDRQMREGAELLSALIGSSQDSIFVVDRDGRLLVANSTFLELADLTRTAVGRKLTVTHDPEMELALNELRERVVATPVPQAADVFAQTRDQGWRALQVMCAPIFGTRGDVWAVAGIGRDVTEARAVAKTLRDARDAAEAADREKTRFLAAASHDLRQPLQAAIMLADLVAQKTESSTPAATLAENLGRSLDDMKRLLGSLFDVSRLDSGAVRPDLKIFPLEPLLDQITMALRPSAESKGIALIVDETNAVVRSDRLLLTRMLSNLIENAVRYTEVGQVRVACQSSDGLARIRVEDTGIGIPRQDLSRIWQEFEQLHNPERDRRQGLGLGLSIVRRLSTLLDHPVDVLSEAGQGSCFTVSVPMTDQQAVTAEETCATSVAERSGNGKLVVVIDDDAMVLDVLRMTLEEWGWDVVAALGGGDALQELASLGRAPDLIVADYRLRDGVGADVIAAIRRDIGSHMPAFILTGELAGSSDELDAPLQDAMRVGATLFRKPISARELMEAVRSVVPEPIA